MNHFGELLNFEYDLLISKNFLDFFAIFFNYFLFEGFNLRVLNIKSGKIKGFLYKMQILDEKKLARIRFGGFERWFFDSIEDLSEHEEGHFDKIVGREVVVLDIVGFD